MPTKTDSRQVKKRLALSRLGSAAGATLESILNNTNTEINSPLRIAASATPDALLNFSSSSITAADAANKVVSPVKKQVFSTLTTPTINFQTQALSNAAHFDISSWPVSTVGYFRNVGFTLIGSGKIKVLFSPETSTEGALANPGALFVSGGLPLGYVTVVATAITPAFKTAGSATNIIENAKIFRFGSGGGGSSSASGSGTGAEILDLRYRAEITDSFQDIPGDETPVDVGTDKTDAANHDVANELFRFSYDASKTVTGTGTAMSLSAAPSFTVKKGDVLVIGDEVKEITAIGSINVNGTGFTIASAFTANPAATAANVSQAVYTKNLNAFDANGTGLAVSSQITDNVSTVLVNYEDSLTLSDVIPDWGSGPHIAYHVTADNTTWGNRLVRQVSLTGQAVSTTTPTSSTQFRIRFFANKTSGSGAVNLLSYKAFWHQQLSEPFGSSYNTAFANLAGSQFVNVAHSVVSGKSRFAFTFSYPMGLNSGNPSGSALAVFVNGQQIPRAQAGITSTTQAYFTEISANVIELDTDYTTSGLEFIFKVPVSVVDSNSSNTTRISSNETVINQVVEPQVIATFLTAVNGTPAAGQFRSDITGRVSIPDPAANLATSLGVQRIMTFSIAKLQDEFGPLGQDVFKSINDKLNQIRFVGTWANTVGTTGSAPTTAIANDYMEIVFWGTGLNLVSRASGSLDVRATVDSAAEGANIFAASYSALLDARNYAPNVVIPVTSGLTLGLHTVKIRNATSSSVFYAFGFEVLNQGTSISVATGTVVKGRYQNILAAIASVSYNSTFESGTLGTRGGNVVTYIKNDGTIGKAVTPTNTSSANLALADHTNEEISRIYNFREFGAGRSDDFSTLTTSVSDRTFVLDDGTTSLSGKNVSVSTTTTVGCAINGNAAGNHLTFTFLGSGLDIKWLGDGSGSNAAANAFEVFIDGSSVGNWDVLTTAGIPNTKKVVSGLPFGTHTVKILRNTASAWTLHVLDFIVYGSKKPTIPVGAIELAQYNVMADYVTRTVGSINYVSQGVLRKQFTREAVFAGTWTFAALDTTSFDGGWNTRTQTSGSYYEYTFYGTGFDLKNFFDSGRVINATISVDSSNNLSAFTTGLIAVSTGLTFTAATGVLAGTTVGGGGVVTQVRGLTLGKHTVRYTTNNTSETYADYIDIITPIYSPSSNMPAITQNAGPIGSSSLNDLRKWNKNQIIEEKNAKVAIAKGVTSNPTTTVTTPVPAPEMSVPWYSDGEWVELDLVMTAYNATSGAVDYFQFYVDGLPVGVISSHQSTATTVPIISMSNKAIVFLPKGFHKIDAYWFVSAGTGTLFGTNRQLTVKKLLNN